MLLRWKVILFASFVVCVLLLDMLEYINVFPSAATLVLSLSIFHSNGSAVNANSTSSNNSLIIWPNDPFESEITTKTVVISHYREDLSYLTPLEGVNIELYTRSQNISGPFSNISIIENKGAESYVFTEYICRNYNNLPDLTLFLHAHEYSWHQDKTNEEIIHKLIWNTAAYCSVNTRTLRSNLVYSNLRRIDTVWNRIFRQILGSPPETFSYICCQQFLATRGSILSRPLQFWKDLRDFLRDGAPPEVEKATVLEWLIGMILTNSSVITEDNFCSFL